MPEIVIVPNTGEMTKPQLHDAYLTGVWEDGPDDVVLRLSHPDSTYEITLHDVKAMCIDEYSERNAVLDCTVLPISAITVPLARRLCHVITDKGALEQISSMSQHPLLLVEITPDFGADVIACCRSIDYRIVECERDGGSANAAG